MNAPLAPSLAAPPAHAAAVQVIGVQKWFTDGTGEQLQVLDRVDLAIPQHSVRAILGTSGCGKSTLLNIIAGIIKPDVGSVRLAAAVGDVRPAVSYMFQEDRLLPWRTAVRNVELALEASRLPRGERRDRARAALALVGLSTFEGAYPHQLSGGMRSRVALARSLVVEPALLLMDEPFSKLDAQTRSHMHRQLLDIHAARPLTIVFVTHDVEEAVVLADRVTVLAARPGRVREEVDIDFPRPRDPISSESTHYIQRLRNLI